jgi:SOS-response transcriptional repressor LexA
MAAAGIDKDDLLVINRTLPLQLGRIIAALAKGELIIRRLEEKQGVLLLAADNAQYPALPLSGQTDFRLLGIVTKRKREREALPARL